ncbi:hypothetical protein DLAC_00288 [Tieghemostelium lacteum]|uniref:FNIP repeat-containing protein n=1 Tax=Tieghemostelium lacteum TaxID=361077 RepID=A0A152A9B7_TIELA|nr:hypothetical protein DLAC_00288 [Tieghemostelium lacteum]|eukprot:KYR02822.1 hypothetical protein DLAC_00288 [Tieghemostelium lacteum]
MNFIVFNEIIQYLEFNQDVINLLRVDKKSYSFRKLIRFPRAPCEFWEKNDSIDIPLKYRVLAIKNDKQYDRVRNIKGLLDNLSYDHLKYNTSPSRVIEPFLTRQERLTKVSLGRDFNQPFYNGLFPLSIVSLKFIESSGIISFFSGKFSQVIIEGHLPEKLLSLSLGNIFNHPIAVNTIPQTLVSLTLGAEFDQNIDFLKPLLNLKKLDLGVQFNREIQPGQLPANLEYLCLSHRYNIPLKPNALPNSLVWLSMSFHYNFDIGYGVLPNNLKRIKFGSRFNSSCCFNSGIERITFGGDFNQVLTNLIFQNPIDSVKCISFRRSASFKQEINENSLPRNIKSLKLQYSFSQPLSELQRIYPNLESLSIGEKKFVLTSLKN